MLAYLGLPFGTYILHSANASTAAPEATMKKYKKKIKSKALQKKTTNEKIQEKKSKQWRRDACCFSGIKIHNNPAHTKKDRTLVGEGGGGAGKTVKFLVDYPDGE